MLCTENSKLEIESCRKKWQRAISVVHNKQKCKNLDRIANPGPVMNQGLFKWKARVINLP
jgi:hypothetical protein